MKTKIIFFYLLVTLNFVSKAQTYVTISDANFVALLTTFYVPSAMNGNQMDTSSTAVTTLTSIDVSNSSIHNLNGIQYFSSLQVLNCQQNQLTSLPTLPSSLTTLDCDHNQLTILPVLPSSLSSLDCDQNQLTILPVLPNSLSFLSCAYNQLTSIPVLPYSLFQLNCNNNQLTSLPTLPNNLHYLYCNANQLTSLPTLGSSLSGFACDNNAISCFPTFPNSLIYMGDFVIIPNPFTCLPNYVPAMDAATLLFPLCVTADTINNIHGCPNSQGITGFIYKDNNTNCIKDTNDLGLMNIPLKSYNSNNSLLYQTYSAINGIYNFPDTVGTYTVKIDTAAIPFTAQCSHPGLDSSVTLTTGNPLINNVNFTLICKPGFDVGVQSVYTSGIVFPGQQHSLSIIAGDMNQWYNMHCAAYVGGQVQVTLTGPVTYNGIVNGAVTPTIVGNVFTYTIPDFGTLNNSQAFGLLFTTDTTAQTGDTICLHISVSPTIGDNNIGNNTYQFCYQVANSYDPNLKEVYPVNVLPGYRDWFTYTIHFQNTGAAPAYNIRLVDTLDTNLDLETFQVINYSHHNTISLQGRELVFRFPSIMLPDSTSNHEASKGFIQYRIKPKPNLLEGSKIINSARIYFDYNPAIVTNTTTNEFTQFTSVQESKMKVFFNVYPNPSNGKYFIKLSEGINGSELKINVYNLLGELVANSKIISSLSQIDLSRQPNGIYIIRVNDNRQSYYQRLIKQ